jgi:DNA-binding LacI/PurR family transcriptional regulator
MGDPDLPEVAQRLRGHRQALAEAERETEPTLELHTPFDANQARADLSRLIESGTGFDAVFACSDVLAMAVVQVLRAHGKEVPRDVAVVGYDDIEWASHAYPPLTTVRQPVSVAGIEIVDALLAIVAGEVVPPRTLPVELVLRRSSLR